MNGHIHTAISEGLSGDQLRRVTSAFSEEAVRYYGSRLLEVVLFGSFARGEATSQSDIDILLVLDGEVQPAQEIRALNAHFVADLDARFGQLISLVPVAAARYQTTPTAFLQTVKREGISLWKK